MKLYTTTITLQEALKAERLKGLKVGFVPTMGALHQGHLSLVNKAIEMCDIVVVSIFVNPTQFNDTKDLDNYPRTLDADQKLLSGVSVDYLFVPTVQDIYPEPDTRIFNFGQIERVMEGAFRPGHFNGVAQVVSKLFSVVEPDLAFFGRKDFQQIAIIQEMVRQLNLGVQIVPCDIVREADGLALSSRNQLLLPEHRQNAPLIFKCLNEAKTLAKTSSVKEVKDFVISQINESQWFEVEYFEIVDECNLSPIANWNDAKSCVGCIAVYAGKVRLIDNIIF